MRRRFDSAGGRGYTGLVPRLTQIFVVVSLAAACSNPRAQLTGLGTSTTGGTGGGRFICHLGDGGLFGSPLHIVTGIGPYSLDNGQPRPLAVGDLNGDGNLDIAEGDFLSGDMGILPGNGDGSFRPAVHANPGLYLYDLLVVSAGSPARPLLVMSGNPTDFAGQAKNPNIGEVDDAGALILVPQPLGVAFGSDSSLATDLNGDGLPDLVMQGSGVAQGNGFQVMLGTPSGGWAPGGFVANWWTPQEDYIGDFNEDGIPDIIVEVGHGTQTLVVHAGMGDGTFSDAGISTTFPPMQIGHWSSGDLNEDGHLDLLVGPGWFPPYVLFGRGDGTFMIGPSVDIAWLNTFAAWPHALYDLNGDGHLDYLGTGIGGTIHVALGKGDGTFAPEMVIQVSAPEDGGGPFIGVVVGDVNNDGRPDLIANNYSDGNVAIFLNQCGE